jgi:hypothetical protein
LGRRWLTDLLTIDGAVAVEVLCYRVLSAGRKMILGAWIWDRAAYIRSRDVLGLGRRIAIGRPLFGTGLGKIRPPVSNPTATSMPYPFDLAYLLMEPSGSKKITRHPLVLYSESTDFYPETPVLCRN